jgi:predicted nucleic acid-binding protein
MAEVLIDTDILIDFSRGMAATADYFTQASLTDTLSISCITQMELIVGCQNKQALRSIVFSPVFKSFQSRLQSPKNRSNSCMTTI